MFSVCIINGINCPSNQWLHVMMIMYTSIGKADHKHSEKVWFYSIGLAGKDEDKNQKGWKMMTLKSLIKHLGHQDVPILLSTKFTINYII